MRKAYAPTLPTGEDLARVIDIHMARERLKLTSTMFRWQLAQAYMQGARRFEMYATDGSRIGAYQFKKDGSMPVRVMELLDIVNRTIGTLAALDLRPQVSREGSSLEGIRERSMAQIVGDAIVSSDQLEQQVKKQFLMLTSIFGMAGISADVVDHPVVGITSDLEVIHGKQLFPFPSINDDLSAVRGLIRERLINVDTMEAEFGKKVRSKLNLTEYYEKSIGEEEFELEQVALVGPTYSPQPPTIDGAPVSPNTNTPYTYRLMKVREMWLYGPRMTVARYACMSGRTVFMDETYDDEECYCPVQVCRFMENNTWRGIGLFDLLFSEVREFEKLVESLCNNARDNNKYPLTILPAGVINERIAFKEDGNAMKYMMVTTEPRYQGDQSLRPITVSPHNMGDAPGKTAAFLGEMIQRRSPVQDLIRQKGRGDSLPFMQFLDEESRKPLSVPVQNMTAAFGAAYRYAIGKAAKMMAASQKPIPVKRLTLGLVGAKVDWKSGTVSFKNNPLPDTSRLSFSTKEGSPRSQAIRKNEALDLFQRYQDFDRFMLLALKEGLDYAIWADDYEASFRSIVQNILTVYSDGDSPGQVILTMHTEQPQIQLRVLNAFMSSPEFRLASVEVQNEFIKYRKTLMYWMQQVLPEQVPDPHDSLLLQQARMGMLQQQQAQGGQPQPQPQFAAAR